MDESGYPPEAWKRLGDHVRLRRVELGWTQPEVQQHGGPSGSVVSKIERGHGYRYGIKVMVKLENALKWRRGSWEAILDDGSPILAEAGTGDNGPTTSPLENEAWFKALLPEQRALIQGILQEPVLTPLAKTILINHYRDQLEQRPNSPDMPGSHTSRP